MPDLTVQNGKFSALIAFSGNRLVQFEDGLCDSHRSRMAFLLNLQVVISIQLLPYLV